MRRQKFRRKLRSAIASRTTKTAPVSINDLKSALDSEMRLCDELISLQDIHFAAMEAHPLDDDFQRRLMATQDAVVKSRQVISRLNCQIVSKQAHAVLSEGGLVGVGEYRERGAYVYHV